MRSDISVLCLFLNLLDFALWYVQVRAKPDKSSEAQEFPNTRLISDISGLSSAYIDDKANQIFNSGPRNCIDVYRSVVHLRKRGQPEIPDPSSDIAKRTKVNGSNTLDRSIKDHSGKLTQVGFFFQKQFCFEL